MKEWLERYTTIKIADLIAIAVSYTIKLLVASILLLIGFWLINRLPRITGLYEIHGNIEGAPG